MVKTKGNGNSKVNMAVEQWDFVVAFPEKVPLVLVDKLLELR